MELVNLTETKKCVNRNALVLQFLTPIKYAQFENTGS